MRETQATMSLPHVPAMSSVLRTFILSPHRLVPLALAAAGRKSQAYSVVGSTRSVEDALRVIAEEKPDVIVFDPTALSLCRIPRWLEEVAWYLPHGRSTVLLLEIAQQATPIAARFAWAAGVRCAVTSQDLPEFWPNAIEAASQGATYASPIAANTFGLSPWDPYRSVVSVMPCGEAPETMSVIPEGLLSCA
jgi:DNA-binding NarL/FixJ family response regulator